MDDKMTATIEEKAQCLRDFGWFVGRRDPRLNTNYVGQWMVVEDQYKDEELPTQDGSNGPWCIVGDDYAALVQEAWDIWAGERPGMEDYIERKVWMDGTAGWKGVTLRGAVPS